MNEENKKNEAGQKTAHTILEKGAKATGIVGAGHIYNKFSKTGIGQNIEKGIGNAISNNGVLGHANKKLNNMSAPSTISKEKQASPQKNKRSLRRPARNSISNNSQNKDVNPNKKENLNAENSSRNLNTRGRSSGLRQRFFGGRKSNNVSETEKSSQEEESDTDDNVTENEEESPIDVEKKQVLKIKKLIKLFSAIFSPIVAVFLVIMIGVALPGAALATAASLLTHKSETPQYVYPVTDTKNHEAEIKYNEAIDGSSDGTKKGIIAEYQSKYNVTIDKLLLHAVLVYRYTNEQDSDLYTNNDNEELSEEELNDRLDQLAKDDTDSSDSDSGIDYSEISKSIKTVAALMVTKNSDGTYRADTEVGGSFYNTLIESDFLKTYYEDFLTDNTYETRKKLVDEIFDYYELEKEGLLTKVGGNFISDSMQIYLQTCETPYDKMKNERGNTVFSNRRNINAGTSYPEYFSLTDYLKGAVEGELGRSSLNEAEKEGVKAFTVATLTYMLGSFYVDFYPQVESINFPSGNCRLVSCDVTNGCTYTKNGNEFGTAYSGVDRFSSGGHHQPWNAEQNAFMDEVLDEIFGVVMVRKGVTAATFKSGDDLKGGNYYDSVSLCKGGNCMGQKEALADSRNGMTYEEILNKYYSDFDLINIKEGIYVEDASYGNGSFDGNIIYYSQTDYHQSFCGRNDGTIASSGCGVTSAAIVISSFTGDRQYNPIYFSDMAKSTGDCGYGISGTMTSFFSKVASKFNYGYEHVSKYNGDRLVELLKQGNALAIAHMGPGHFTGGGHYVVISQVNDKGEVYVVDPNHNRATGWFSLNDIVAKESKTGFYVIIKNTPLS